MEESEIGSCRSSDRMLGGLDPGTRSGRCSVEEQCVHGPIVQRQG